MFKGKPVGVVMTDGAKEAFDNLNEAVSEELARGVASSSNQILLRAINQKMKILSMNPEYGAHLPKSRIPKEYLLRPDVSNLWKLNLSGAWRMIYTIHGEEVEILALIIDILNHRDYEKKFGYRKS